MGRNEARDCIIYITVSAPGLLQPLPVPQWKREDISMDFVVGLPRSQQGHDAIWVFVDRLTKTAHFIAYSMTYSVEHLNRLYIQHIVCLHGVPVTIVSDRDSRFTAEFWRSLQAALGTSLNLSSAFHPYTDGQTERVNQVMEDMLRACVIDFESSWEIHLPLIEFTYNNSYHTSIGMAPFEALYGRPCQSPLYWAEVKDKKLLGPEMIRETSEKIKVVREKMKTVQTRHKSCTDKHHRGLEFKVEEHVFLKVSPIRGIVYFG